MDAQPSPVFGAEAAPEWACLTPASPTPGMCSLYLEALGPGTEPGFLLWSPTWAEYTEKSLDHLLKWIPQHLNTQKLYVLSL